MKNGVADYDSNHRESITDPIAGEGASDWAHRSMYGTMAREVLRDVLCPILPINQ